METSTDDQVLQAARALIARGAQVIPNPRTLNPKPLDPKPYTMQAARSPIARGTHTCNH
jgi:hypothetical protein